MNARLVRRIVTAAISLHSLILGAVMLVAPRWMLATFGWPDSPDTFFFVHQSGIFLVVLGGGYAAGIWYRPFAWFMVATKVAAVVFLVDEYLISSVPGSILLAAAMDAMMGTVALFALLWERRVQAE